MSRFTITEHFSPCQHIRGYPHAVRQEDAKLQLAVKEYRPRRSLQGSAAEAAVTLIAVHGNALQKELYEPLFEDLVSRETDGFRIGSIWIADMAHQGASYAVNKELLGDDNDWLDHSRDLLLMINCFRDKMKAPFVGLAHSMGCAQLVWLSHMHPRLFHSLVLVDPVIFDYARPGPNAAMISSRRRKTFPSRALAESSMRTSPFFKSWDVRALNAYLKYGLLDCADGSVALATPPAQEALTYVRANFHPLPEDTTTREARQKERLLNPDLVPFSEVSKLVFTRPECLPVVEALPHLRPRTLFIYGEMSHMNDEKGRDRNITRTGTGRGGNGGLADGGVEVKVMEGVGHACCFEEPAAVAADVAVWLDKEMARWRREVSFWETYDKGTTTSGGKELSHQWMAAVREDATLQRPVQSEESKL